MAEGGPVETASERSNWETITVTDQDSGISYTLSQPEHDRAHRAAESSRVDWPHPAVVQLLETIQKHIHHFRGPPHKRPDVWRKIASDLCARGHSYTLYACTKKWDNMKTRYKVIKDRRQRKGERHTRWAYFERMEKLLQGNHCDTPEVSASSPSEVEANWPHPAVVLLLETYRKHLQLFRFPKLKSNDIWKKISSDMCKGGHSYTPQACQKKWDNMKTRYKIIADRSKGTGKGRKKWEYFVQMDELVQLDTPDTPLVTDPSPEETDSSEANWHHTAVVQLLETYQNHHHLFQSHKGRRNDVWKRISSDLCAKGFSCTLQACSKKWDNLKTRYKIITGRNKCMGNDQIRWAYFDQIDEILRGDPSDAPSVTFSSPSGVELHQAKKRMEAKREASSTTATASPPAPDLHQNVPQQDSLLQTPPKKTGKRGRPARRKGPPQRLKEPGDQSHTLQRILAATQELNSLVKQLVDKP